MRYERVHSAPPRACACAWVFLALPAWVRRGLGGGSCSWWGVDCLLQPAFYPVPATSLPWPALPAPAACLGMGGGLAEWRSCLCPQPACKCGVGLLPFFRPYTHTRYRQTGDVPLLQHERLQHYQSGLPPGIRCHGLEQRRKACWTGGVPPPCYAQELKNWAMPVCRCSLLAGLPECAGSASLFFSKREPNTACCRARANRASGLAT